jgi:hypothetical protein
VKQSEEEAAAAASSPLMGGVPDAPKVDRLAGTIPDTRYRRHAAAAGAARARRMAYTELLVRAGIDAISVNIDVVDRTRRLIDAAERRLLLDAARGRVEQ